MSQGTKRIVQRFIDEVWNTGNLDAIDDLVAEDHIDHDPVRLRAPGGPAAVREFIERYRAIFPDVHVELGNLIAEGDLVAGTWVVTGTHQGTLLGIPATGRKVSVSGIGIDRVRDGQIVESWASWDGIGLLVQLGALPSGPQD
jgi:steroid delta-isomerase-like uncharacterized protein